LESSQRKLLEYAMKYRGFHFRNWIDFYIIKIQDQIIVTVLCPS